MYVSIDKGLEAYMARQYFRTTYLSVIKIRKAAMSASAGLAKCCGRLDSQKELPILLPMAWTNATCSGSHVSCASCRMNRVIVLLNV